jgi:hypothetical protein
MAFMKNPRKALDVNHLHAWDGYNEKGVYKPQRPSARTIKAVRVMQAGNIVLNKCFAEMRRGFAESGILLTHL